MFESAGFSIVIWANHILRSSIAAMRQTAERLHRERSLVAIEDGIVPVAEVFRLQGEDELAEQEGRYLPAADMAQAIVLAASRGVELGELTVSRPKAMVPIGGVPLLQRILDTYRRGGVQRFVVVRGYCAPAVNLDGPTYADNPQWDQGGELTSLARGLQACDGGGDLFVSYGDVLFKRYVVEQLLDTDADWSIAVDTHWQESA